MREPYPLSWPDGWTRTKAFLRKHSRLAGSFAVGRDGVRYELGRINAANIVITSNVQLNWKGVPDGRTANGSIQDPGVAVWWMQKGGVERVLACDKWQTPGENLRAIAKSLEALRGVDRWGASQIIERAFAGFNALPAGGEVVSAPDWWETLEIDQELFKLPSEDLLAIVQARYKRLARIAHPDAGGAVDQMVAINTAYEEAKRYCSNIEDA